MSDTTGTELAAQPRRTVAPLRAGANALGIVPQTIEDVWRVAGMIVQGKMVPDAMTKKRNAEEQRSAVSTIILSGLELGLSPMVALRSFGLINGRPGLYGDGLINVCRRHQTCEFIKMGFERNNPAKLLTLGKTQDEVDAMQPDELTYGWCKAKRRDTGEEDIVIFTKQDAIDADLWDERPEVSGTIWENGNSRQGMKKNDAPWFRYKPRMMQWRAAGYCLRNLFADVLGGVPTMDELQEVFGEDEMRDVTPTQITRSSPPPPPDEEEAEEFDAAVFADTIYKLVADATDEATLIQQWEAASVDELLADHGDHLDSLYDARNARIAVFDGDVTDEDEGGEQADEPSLPLDDGSDFPGDPKK